jgi:putative acyl-CoA dehydrogenase
VLRSIQKEPASLDVLLEEVNCGGERASQGAAPIYRLLKDAIGVELQARRIVESIATALQASLMARHAAHEAADAFCASRLAGDWGRAFGTLPSTASCEAIVRRALALGPRPA